MPPPLIAVTTSEIRASGTSAATLYADPDQSEMVLGMRYLRALEEAGAVPMVVPPLTGGVLDSLLDRVDGVCLSGGPDIHPAAYDAAPHLRLGPTWRELDRFELALAQAADARGLPILAICRGLQVLNVARGGTLHQHLPDVGDESIVHRQTEAAGAATHLVSIEAGSRLGRMAASPELMVNSFHHQAIDRLGHNLVITACAPDGTIEGIEAIDRPFVVGVQWHAESLTGEPGQPALFEGLVAAATGEDRTLVSAA